MSNDLIVTMRDVRAAKLCMKGARAWFLANGLDFRRFVAEGIPADVLRATGDPLAARAVTEAEKRAGNG